MGVCNCSMYCCTLLYVHSSIASILMGKRELIALLNLSSWCLVMVERLFLAVPQGCLQFVIVVFPDHTDLLFLNCMLSLSVLPCSQCSLQTITTTAHNMYLLTDYIHIADAKNFSNKMGLVCHNHWFFA